MELNANHFTKSLSNFYIGNSTPAETLQNFLLEMASTMERINAHGAKYGLFTALQRMATTYVQATADTNPQREETIKAAYHIAATLETICAHSEQMQIFADYLTEITTPNFNTPNNTDTWK